MYALAALAVPKRVVTVTSTGPREWAGSVTLIWVELLLVIIGNLVPWEVPNVTDVAPFRLAPVIVTVCPPVVYPLAGSMLVIMGLPLVAFGAGLTWGASVLTWCEEV